MKLVRPLRIPREENMQGSVLNPFTASFLQTSFDLLAGWFPYSAEEIFQRYREKDPSFRFSVTAENGRIQVLFSLPWLDENGSRITDIASAASGKVSLLVGLVFNHEREILGDLALYHLSAADMRNEKIRDAFEQESDWLYWEAYILDTICLQDHTASSDEEVLIYTNAYTTRDERRKGIFTSLMRLSEAFFAEGKKEVTLYSAISLDPDIACYGKDKQDEPYIYSMKDEPARLRNAEIIGKLGFTPLKLETDEEVEDGSLLWFAWKKSTFIELDPIS